MTPYTLTCSACFARNRIPAEKKGQQARCGKCAVPLDTVGFYTETPLTVTDESFDTTVLKAPLPVLVDCWAPWCGPCRMLGPVVDQLAKEWAGKIRVAKLNVDENPAVAARFQTRSVPTLLVFHKGKRTDTMVGALPKAQITARMAPFLG